MIEVFEKEIKKKGFGLKKNISTANHSTTFGSGQCMS
jgi:hypothetical protein